MAYRVPNSIIPTTVSLQINTHRARISVLQERITTGKRINRPSDDPVGAGAILNLRTSQTEVEQFRKAAESSNQKLSVADGTLDSYSELLERVKTKFSEGFSGTTSQESKNILAVEIESLRGAVLGLANQKAGEEYIFGGIRQDSPPFDPTTGIQNPNPTVPRYVQIEPGSNAIAIGAVAEEIFADSTSNVFADIDAAITALRGTGDSAADLATIQNTIERLKVYTDLGAIAQAKIGGNMALTTVAKDRLANDSLNLDTQANAIETADLAETAIAFTEAQTALDATLQVAARNKRSLLDFLG